MKTLRSSETILIVDDQSANIDILVHILQDHYSLRVARDGSKAIRIAEQHAVDLILLDVMMPKMDGFEVCRVLKARPQTAKIPIIFVTALCGAENESLGLQRGAVDYITKPFSQEVVLARVRTHLALLGQQRHLETLVSERNQELEETRLEIIRHLGRAAELRDNETGLHVIRVSNYAYHIARAAGLDENQARLIQTVAPLHDVGKIGIPDHILLKQGSLTDDEWKVIHAHCLIGYQIIGDQGTELLRTAAICAYCHHERWDGSGYPRRLAGEEIPLVARILAVADVFDALTCKRPYKAAWTAEEAIDEIRRCSGAQFDPAIVTAFLRALTDILAEMEKFTESQQTGPESIGAREASRCQQFSTAA